MAKRRPDRIQCSTDLPRALVAVAHEEDEWEGRREVERMDEVAQPAQDSEEEDELDPGLRGHRPIFFIEHECGLSKRGHEDDDV